MYFNIKYRYSCAYGSIHFSKFILYSKYLLNNLLNIVKKVIEENAYFTHPENVLIAMIFDKQSNIRHLAYKTILSARENADCIDDVEPFILPRINFDCNDYVNMIDWNSVHLAEPAFTLSHDEIIRFISSNTIIKGNSMSHTDNWAPY